MSLPHVLAVVGQLFGRGIKHVLADDHRNRNRDLIFRFARISRYGMPRMLRSAATWTQSRTVFTYTRLAVNRPANVGGVFQEFTHGLPTPSLALGAWDAFLSQPTNDLPRGRHAVAADPLENLPDHLGLHEVHLILRLPAARPATVFSHGSDHP